MSMKGGSASHMPCAPSRGSSASSRQCSSCRQDDRAGTSDDGQLANAHQALPRIDVAGQTAHERAEDALALPRPYQQTLRSVERVGAGGPLRPGSRVSRRRE